MDIESERIKVLSGRNASGPGDYVLCWMQQSQRTRCNHALEYAITEANHRRQPVVVCFGLMGNYPEANTRHYHFLLEGLQQVETALAERGIPFVVQKGEPAEVALALSAHASLLVCDRGYLRHQRLWRQRMAEEARCPVVQVEADVVTPIEIASGKLEFAARTLRPKIGRQSERFLRELPPQKLQHPLKDAPAKSLDLRDIPKICRSLQLDDSVPPVPQHFHGGEAEAARVFSAFCQRHLATYAENRNQPQTDEVSQMSKYLHFGQVSPVWLALQIRRHAPDENVKSFLEELLVRRELAMNFVYFNPAYDDFSGLPEWSRKTLEKHARDRRDPSYTRAQFEQASTHDPYWNAAMREMIHTGYMHNYMRMYWGKKILEWSASPEEAHATALAINNKYFLDGRDANSFSNVAWLFGQHDRPWGERPIYGAVRSMSAAGLERKCDIEAYIEKVDRLCRAQPAPRKA